MISRATQKNLIKEVKERTGLKFKVRFRDLSCGATAETYLRDRIIVFDKSARLTKSKFLSTFFHEIAHLIAYKERKFPIFHSDYAWRKSKKLAKDFLRTALRAERYVDKQGMKLCSKYYCIKWDYSYIKQADIDWFNIDNNDVRARWGMKLYKRRKYG